MTSQLALFSAPAPPPPPPRVVERYGWRWRRDHTTWDPVLPAYVCEPREGVLAVMESHGAVWTWAVFGLGRQACGEAESKQAAEEAVREETQRLDGRVERHR